MRHLLGLLLVTLTFFSLCYGDLIQIPLKARERKEKVRRFYSYPVDGLSLKKKSLINFV